MQNKVGANCEAGPAFACFAVDRNRVVLVLSEEQDCIDCKLKDHWEGSRVVVHHGKVGQLEAIEAFAGVSHRDDSLGDVAEVEVEIPIFVSETVATDNRFQKFNFLALFLALPLLNIREDLVISLLGEFVYS